MSVTDFERGDDLDGLTSRELETRAFGPEPRSLRGLLRRPAPALPAPPPAADGTRRRGRTLAVAALALGLAGAGAFFLTLGRPAPHEHAEHVEFHYHDDFGTYERIEDSHTYLETDLGPGDVVVGDGEIVEGEDVFFDDGEVVEF